MTTSELTTKDSNAIIKAGQDKPAMEVLQDRVILSLAVPLRNGQWEEYPKNYSVWKRKDGLYEQAQLLEEGEEIWVRWTEKPAPRGVYRDIVAIRAKGAGLPEAPAAPIFTEDESSEAIWESMGATKTPPSQQPAPQSPPKPSTVPNTAPAHANGDADKDLSIRSQVALKEAWETVRDLIRIEKVGWDNPAVLHRLLADFTLMGMAVMREAMDAQKSK